MKQGCSLTAKADFQFKAPGARGRTVKVRSGQRFWVTSSETDQQRSGVVMIDREGRGCISHGYAWQPDQLAQFFSVEAR